jgi:beta-xylosidase
VGIETGYTAISDEGGRVYTMRSTGALVGMACHDISGRRQRADFEFFEYSEHQPA